MICVHHDRGIIILLVLSVMIIQSAKSIRAQEHRRTEVKSMGAEAKSWAIQFGVPSLLQFHQFKGAVISLRRDISDREAIRIGLSLGSLDRSVNYSNLRTFSNTTREMYRDIDYNGFNVDLAIEMLRYSGDDSEFRAFYGLGPFIGAGSWNNRDNYKVRDPESIGTYKGSGDSFYLGSNIFLGVEWKFARSVGLHIEYGLKIQYTKINSKVHYESTYPSYSSEGIFDTDQKRLTMGGSSLLMGISLWI